MTGGGVKPRTGAYLTKPSMANLLEVQQAVASEVSGFEELNCEGAHRVV